MWRQSKAKWCLIGCLVVVLAFVVGSVFIPSRLTDAVKWLANNDLAGRLRGLPKQEANQESRLIEMVADSVRVSKIDNQPVVILKKKGEDIYLPVWIGPNEANAIAVVLEAVKVSRPLTADLFCSIINRMGASVDYIVINDIQNNTFYANIVLKANLMKMDIDARPSDAIAIALRIGAPIYVEKAVLDKAGIRPEREAGKYTTSHLERVKIS